LKPAQKSGDSATLCSSRVAPHFWQRSHCVHWLEWLQMKWLSIAGLCLSMLTFQAAACGMKTGYVPFEYAAGATAHEAEPKVLKAPKVALMDVIRGVNANAGPGSCDGSGMVIVKLKWSGGDYRPDEVGFEFRVVSGQTANAGFPDGPVALAPDIQRDELTFLWDDDAPSQQQPLQMEVEVRAVTRDHLYGPASTFTIDTRDADAIKRERAEQKDAEKARKKQEREQQL
jgi:hypothetical protein